MSRSWYIASCVFTSQFPELSLRIREYVQRRFGMAAVRCCVPRYKLRDFEDRMPEGELREAWQALPDCGDFQPGDDVYSLCHNCVNIIGETRPGVRVHSLWELIDADDAFPLPDLTGLTATVQDCWRSRDRRAEQDAVRSLLSKMGVNVVELPENRERTRFCGASLYRPQPPRNPKLAPRYYVDGAQGLFQPHTGDEQRALMADYCAQLKTDAVICYCHYCLEGLKLGGANAKHIAELLF